MNVIVVGVDHSPGANAALVFAEDEARLRGATLRAVHAWQYGYIGYTGFEGGMPALGGDIKKMQAAAEAALEASVVRRCASRTSRSSSASFRARRPPSLSRSRGTPICWSSARAGTADSRSSCWARSASSAPTTPNARS